MNIYQRYLQTLTNFASRRWPDRHWLLWLLVILAIVAGYGVYTDDLRLSLLPLLLLLWLLIGLFVRFSLQPLPPVVTKRWWQLLSYGLRKLWRHLLALLVLLFVLATLLISLKLVSVLIRNLS